MAYSDLRPLQEKLYFTVEDVASLLQIKPESAQVLCSRYTKRGLFVRLKKNFYVLEESWNHYDDENFFRLANYLQVPSYVSCISALSFYGVTTQVPRQWYESVSLKRTVRYAVRGATFYYFKLKAPYYFGFVKMGKVFIAEKEKAFLDACHLSACGEYAVDWSAVNVGALDKAALDKMMEPFPDKTKKYARDVCRI
jgi:predicted transcriptional regulator of viral defense system